MKQYKTTIEYYICPECGMKFPIPRKKRREKGHIKDLWCPGCKKIQKFVKGEQYESNLL